MKTNKYLSLLFIAVFFAACSDEPIKTDSGLSTQQKIQNVWGLELIYDINYVGQSSAIDYIDTFAIGIQGDYVDFRTDNKAYVYIDGDRDTSDYSILSDTKFILDEDTLTISTLTTNQFTLTYYDRTSSDYYDNVIKMKR